jgi:hypothetical protein
VTHDAGSGGVAVNVEFVRDEDEAAELLRGTADDMSSDDIVDI